jgi:hypothetical protein
MITLILSFNPLEPLGAAYHGPHPGEGPSYDQTRTVHGAADLASTPYLLWAWDLNRRVIISMISSALLSMGLLLTSTMEYPWVI